MAKTIDFQFEKSKSRCPIILSIEKFVCKHKDECSSKNCILKTGTSTPTLDVDISEKTGNLIVYCYHGAKK